MKKMILWVTAAFAALALIGAPSAAFAAEDEPLRLPAPIQIDGCGPEEDVYDQFDLPQVDGVFYGIYDYTGATAEGWLAVPEWNYGFEEGVDAILVIASYSNWSDFGDDPIAPEGDYVLDSSGNPGWWFPAFSDEPCTVTAPAPVFTDPAGPGNLTVSYASGEGYAYTQRRYSNGKLQVNAVAAPGYVLVGTTQWSKLDR